MKNNINKGGRPKLTCKRSKIVVTPKETRKSLKEKWKMSSPHLGFAPPKLPDHLISVAMKELKLALEDGRSMALVLGAVAHQLKEEEPCFTLFVFRGKCFF
jgi:hypothetical protein